MINTVSAEPALVEKITTLAGHLDGLGVPIDAGRVVARRALVGAGVRTSNAALVAALTRRRAASPFWETASRVAYRSGGLTYGDVYPAEVPAGRGDARGWAQPLFPLPGEAVTAAYVEVRQAGYRADYSRFVCGQMVDPFQRASCLLLHDLRLGQLALLETRAAIAEAQGLAAQAVRLHESADAMYGASTRSAIALSSAATTVADHAAHLAELIAPALTDQGTHTLRIFLTAWCAAVEEAEAWAASRRRCWYHPAVAPPDGPTPLRAVPVPPTSPGSPAVATRPVARVATAAPSSRPSPSAPSLESAATRTTSTGDTE